MFIFQLQENQDDIENMMNAIFKGVFVHRYRYVKWFNDLTCKAVRLDDESQLSLRFRPCISYLLHFCSI